MVPSVSRASAAACGQVKNSSATILREIGE
jgi:hypothetical protein